MYNSVNVNTGVRLQIITLMGKQNKIKQNFLLKIDHIHNIKL